MAVEGIHDLTVGHTLVAHMQGKAVPGPPVAGQWQSMDASDARINIFRIHV